jgi:hypothetical protein
MSSLFSLRHGYSEQEMEEAILHRKPIASRALYTLIERRLKEGLGWPDRTYHSSTNAHSSSSLTGGAALGDGSSDVIILDKLGRHEPLLPGRRVQPQLSPQQTSSTTTNGQKLSREKSNYAFDEQALLRANTNGSSVTGGLTQEALNELVPPPRLNSRKLFHDIILRKSSAVGSSIDPNDENISTRRIQNSNNLAPIKPLVTAQRGNVIVPQQQQQQKMKPRSLPSSTLDHVNQNGFHLPHDPLAGVHNGIRTPKNLSRTSQIDHTRKLQQNSPIRYNPGKIFISIFEEIFHVDIK